VYHSSPMRPLFLAVFLLTAVAAPAWQAPPPPSVVDQAWGKAQAGDLTGAIALLETLRGKAGAPPPALSLLGFLYLQTDRPRDALALLGPLADTEAAGPLILENAGRAALLLGETARGERYLERAVEKAPVSPASRELGLLRGRQGRPVDSYKLLRPWALAHPEDREARLAAAFGAVELRRAPEARELLAGLPENEPRVRLLHGRLLLEEGDPRGAIATLTPLLEGAPALDPDVRRFLAEARSAVGESEEAVKLLAGRTGQDRDLALLLAKAQYQSGDPAGAAATLEPVARDLLGREPATPGERAFAAEIALEHGRALVGLGKWPEAVAALEKATAWEPAEPQGWQLLGQAQLAAGRREDATRSLARLREIQAGKSNAQEVTDKEKGRQDPTARNLQKARDLAAQGRSGEALALLRQEADLASNDPRPRIAEATLLLSLGRAQEALQAAEAGLRAAPGNPELAALRDAAKDKKD
jgi:predicted Zn-dependent protease